MRPALELVRNAVETVFPGTCPNCRESVSAAHALCPNCWPDVSFLAGSGCYTCGRPVSGAESGEKAECDGCLKLAPCWQRGRAAIRYEGAGRKLVLGLKHGDRMDLVPMFADWMQRVAPDLLADADLIAPVPLHWTRRLKRRANQAAVLARALCGRSGRRRRFAPRLLLRSQQTESQDGKDRAARAANVEAAFQPGPDARWIEGRRVLLIDDVFTTGATLNSCARTALTAGAVAVDILVLALVVRDEASYIRPSNEDESDETI